MKSLSSLTIITALIASIFPSYAQESGSINLSPEAGIALLDPQFAIGKSHLPVAEEIIVRAREALDRQPSLIDIRVEGVSTGKTSINMKIPKPEEGTSRESNSNTDSSLQKKSPKAGGTRDLEISLNLALAWRLTSESVFLDQAGKYIDTWANYKLTFNPINETNFSLLILAYDLTEKDLPDSTREKMDDFCRNMALGYLIGMETGNVDIPQTLSINWQIHRIVLTTLAAFQLGDIELIERAHNVFNKHIEVNLKPDGSTLDFHQRDALHYVNYGIQPMLVAAFAAKVHGADWYSFHSSNGSSLQTSLDWYANYATGKETHMEFVNSLVPYDRQRAAAGHHTFSIHQWEPVTAVETFRIAAELDERFIMVRDQLNQLARESEDPDIIRIYSSWNSLLASERHTKFRLVI